MNPYESLPKSAFWRTGVAGVSPWDIAGLWQPKWPIEPTTRIATAGSCFAQHFGAALRRRGYAWVDAEPAPFPLSPERRRDFGYDVFSARTGNIYTARQLLQWLRWSQNPDTAPAEAWQGASGWFDPFRPSIEPGGFASQAEMIASRRTALASLSQAVRQADIFVFTLGLTECWRHAEAGHEYPVCPGTVAGSFDPAVHRFHNQTFAQIRDDMLQVIALLRSMQPAIRILLTVSPVPLTATASDRHVLVATTHSKSVLRAVAGEIAVTFADCDYFPSYEIITASPYRAMFYAPNLRSVTQHGVDWVMRQFFSAVTGSAADGADLPTVRAAHEAAINATPDPLCDDAALEKFAGA